MTIKPISRLRTLRKGVNETTNLAQVLLKMETDLSKKQTKAVGYLTNSPETDIITLDLNGQEVWLRIQEYREIKSYLEKVTTSCVIWYINNTEIHILYS